MVVPAGATNLKFVTSGGTGDADLYVKFGSAPTDDRATTAVRSAAATPRPAPSPRAQAGTYYVLAARLLGVLGPVSLTGSYTTGGGGGTQTYSNTTDYTISDNATVDSPITVSGRTGNAPSNASVTVTIVHTYKGDLKVDLVAPDGSLYNIHNRTGGSADNVNKTVHAEPVERSAERHVEAARQRQRRAATSATSTAGASRSDPVSGRAPQSATLLCPGSGRGFFLPDFRPRHHSPSSRRTPGSRPITLHPHHFIPAIGIQVDNTSPPSRHPSESWDPYCCCCFCCCCCCCCCCWPPSATRRQDQDGSQHPLG